MEEKQVRQNRGGNGVGTVRGQRDTVPKHIEGRPGPGPRNKGWGKEGTFKHTVNRKVRLDGVMTVQLGTDYQDRKSRSSSSFKRCPRRRCTDQTTKGGEKCTYRNSARHEIGIVIHKNVGVDAILTRTFLGEGEEKGGAP